jgi:putative oxidoreductase
VWQTTWVRRPSPSLRLLRTVKKDHGVLMQQTIASWEVYSRSILRFILAFTFSLHGYRHLFGAFSASAGRRAALPMALDALPSFAGGLEIIGGLLLFAGLLTRPTAIVLCAELAAAYLYSAAPRGIWPIRNGGNETLIYLLVFLYFAVAGAGAWSIDQLIHRRGEKA